MQIRAFILSWWYGLRFKYPVCCVYEFAMDSLRGDLPATMRAGDPNAGFVPCRRCGELTMHLEKPKTEEECGLRITYDCEFCGCSGTVTPDAVTNEFYCPMCGQLLNEEV